MSRSVKLWILFVSILGAAWAWRLVLLLEKNIELRLPDLQGALNDFSMALVVFFLVLMTAPFSRVLSVFLGVIWIVVNAVNYEYVRVFDSLVELTYVHYLKDFTFATGSGTHVSHPVLLLMILAVFLWSAWSRPAVSAKVSVSSLLAGTGLLILSTLIPQPDSFLDWRRQQVVVANVTHLMSDEAVASSETSPDREVVPPQHLQGSLDGEPRIALPGKAENVLLVVLEGVSGAFLPSFSADYGLHGDIEMPGLDAIRKRGISYRHFISHQRQTNRGTYSLLCGDFPKLDSSMARMSEVASASVEQGCLPRTLADAGYHTAYLQAAPLSFMMKDRFMGLAGFEQIEGEADFARANQRTAWGVDDKAFFDQALERIEEFQGSSSPWFATLLTAGTHHPYNVPSDAQLSGNEKQQAFGYLDQAIEAFIEGLEEAGVLEDTLVLITSDESSGIASGADDFIRQLTQNWSFMIALLPDGEGGGVVIDEPYGQLDLSLSVLDYLDELEKDDSGPLPLGRSIFRLYDENRPVFMANTYAKKQHALADGRLLTCQEGLEHCQLREFDAGGMFSSLEESEQESKVLRDELSHVVDYSRREIFHGDDSYTMTLMPPGEVTLEARNDNQVLFGGQGWDFPAGTHLSVTLDLELEGKGKVKLLHSLLNGERGFHHADIPAVQNGGQVDVSYQVGFDKPEQGVHANLTVRHEDRDPVTLRVNEATMTVTPP